MFGVNRELSDEERLSRSKKDKNNREIKKYDDFNVHCIGNHGVVRSVQLGRVMGRAPD